MRTLQSDVNWDPRIPKSHGLVLCIGIIGGTRPEKENSQLPEIKKAVYQEVRAKYTVESLKDNATVRAFRDFYWKLNIDPTKTRPAGEALLRRVLHGRDLPSVSTIVDAYNLASLKTIIPLSGFDRDLVSPPFSVRLAESEVFTGIGMNKPARLTNKTLVLADEKQVLCIYPYRDSDTTKITMHTRNVVMVSYGVLGISDAQLKEAADTALAYVKQVSGGEIKSVTVHKP